MVICPEVVGGLSTPRAPAEYNKQLDKVITTTGVDVTDAFHLGAKTALTLCQNHHIEFALLKEKIVLHVAAIPYMTAVFLNKKLQERASPPSY